MRRTRNPVYGQTYPGFESLSLRQLARANASHTPMPNIATLLKTEIARIANREVRAQTLRLKKLPGQYRSDIAALKRRVLALEQQVKRLSKAGAGKALAPEAADGPSLRRFSASGFAAHRRRLGLSVEAFGKLLDVSGQSVRKWEEGKAYPRKRQFGAIAAVRKMSKKQAAAQLEQQAD